MIGILLGILKWIGIFVLATLGLTFFLIFLILLVPVRYRLQGTRAPEDGVLTARGKVSWLLSILAVTFVYDKEFSWKVRIFGIPLKIGEKSPEEDTEELTEEQITQIAELEAELSEDLKDSSKEASKEIFKEASKETSKETSKENLKGNIKEVSKPNSAEKSFQSKEFQPSLQAQEVGAGKKAEKVPIMEKLRGIGQKISETLHSIPEKIAGIREKIRSLKAQADIWIEFIKSDEMKQLLTTCKKQIGQILRHLIPTRLNIRGNYGFEDPSLTGKITGFICALPPKYQKNIQVQPHFHEECLDGEVMLQGRIRLGSLLWPLIRILLKPCTWKVYKKYRAITRPQAGNDGAETSKKAKKGKKETKKKSGRSGDSHKKQATNTKNDPHKGGKQ